MDAVVIILIGVLISEIMSRIIWIILIAQKMFTEGQKSRMRAALQVQSTGKTYGKQVI